MNNLTLVGYSVDKKGNKIPIIYFQNQRDVSAVVEEAYNTPILACSRHFSKIGLSFFDLLNKKIPVGDSDFPDFLAKNIKYLPIFFLFAPLVISLFWVLLEKIGVALEEKFSINDDIANLKRVYNTRENGKISYLLSRVISKRSVYRRYSSALVKQGFSAEDENKKSHIDPKDADNAKKMFGATNTVSKLGAKGLTNKVMSGASSFLGSPACENYEKEELLKIFEQNNISKYAYFGTKSDLNNNDGSLSQYFSLFNRKSPKLIYIVNGIVHTAYNEINYSGLQQSPLMKKTLLTQQPQGIQQLFGSNGAQGAQGGSSKPINNHFLGTNYKVYAGTNDSKKVHDSFKTMSFFYLNYFNENNIKLIDSFEDFFNLDEFMSLSAAFKIRNLYNLYFEKNIYDHGIKQEKDKIKNKEKQIYVDYLQYLYNAGKLKSEIFVDL